VPEPETEVPEAETEAGADTKEPEAETEAGADTEEPEAETEAGADTEEPEAETETSSAEAGAAGGQLNWGCAGGRDDAESASERGRWVPAWRPPPVRLNGNGAPIALIRSGTWLGSTTYTTSRRRPGHARMIMPAMTVRVPIMSSAQVAELSQPGRNSAVLCTCRPGSAPGFITTRLYGRF
jgi:hypothetical protein